MMKMVRVLPVVMVVRLMKLRLHNQLRMFKICHGTRVWSIVTCCQLKSAALYILIGGCDFVNLTRIESDTQTHIYSFNLINGMR